MKKIILCLLALLFILVSCDTNLCNIYGPDGYIDSPRIHSVKFSPKTAKVGDTIILDMNGVNIFENDRYTEWKVYLTDSTVNDQEITQTKVISATQLEIVLPQNTVSRKGIFINFKGNPPDSLGPCESSEEDREYYSCASSDKLLIIVDENGNEITE